MNHKDRVEKTRIRINEASKIITVAEKYGLKTRAAMLICTGNIVEYVNRELIKGRSREDILTDLNTEL
jgi:hypothetical protein